MSSQWMPKTPDYLGATWEIEKSENVARYIAWLIDDLKDRADVSPELMEVILTHLSPMAWDALKLYASACGSMWGHQDRDLLIERGEDGFEQIAVKYGQLQETRLERRRRRVLSFIAAFREELDSPRSTGARTRLYDILRKYNEDYDILRDYSNKSPFIERITSALENVTNGVLPWETFCMFAYDQLAAFEAEINQ